MGGRSRLPGRGLLDVSSHPLSLRGRRPGPTWKKGLIPETITAPISLSESLHLKELGVAAAA